MCHADVGIITYQWSSDSLIPQANSTTHQCANWKKLDAWTKARTVDMMKPGWLVHPTKGAQVPCDARLLTSLIIALADCLLSVC